MQQVQDSVGELEFHTIGVYRTSATVKGGRRFSFGALVVAGDRNGKVGYGYGKANEVPSAIEKAQKEAKRSMIAIARLGTTIQHEVTGVFGSAKVRMLPATPGTGVVAGATVRAVLEMGGITDCMTKCYGSTNARNVVKAIFNGLGALRTPDEVAALRGVDLGETAISARINKARSNVRNPVAPEEGELSNADAAQTDEADKPEPKADKPGADQPEAKAEKAEAKPEASAPATEKEGDTQS